MILTEVFVVMCTLAGTQCFNYVDVASGILSPPPANKRSRKSCTSMFVRHGPEPRP